MSRDGRIPVGLTCNLLDWLSIRLRRWSWHVLLKSIHIHWNILWSSAHLQGCFHSGESALTTVSSLDRDPNLINIQNSKQLLSVFPQRCVSLRNLINIFGHKTATITTCVPLDHLTAHFSRNKMESDYYLCTFLTLSSLQERNQRHHSQLDLSVFALQFLKLSAANHHSLEPGCKWYNYTWCFISCEVVLTTRSFFFLLLDLIVQKLRILCDAAIGEIGYVGPNISNNNSIIWMYQTKWGPVESRSPNAIFHQTAQARLMGPH